jgi:hypothetical protein
LLKLYPVMWANVAGSLNELEGVAEQLR